MAVKGNGTAESPYVCESFEDLKSIGAIYFANETAPETRPDYITMSGEAENKIIDFNDIAPDGFGYENHLKVNVGKIFDWNDWTVTNLVTREIGVELAATNGAACLKNLTLNNFSWNTSRNSNTYILQVVNSAYYEFQNVKIYGECGISKSSAAFDWTYNSVILKNCVIKLKINTNALINPGIIYVSSTTNLFSDNVVCDNNIDIDFNVASDIYSSYDLKILQTYNNNNSFIGNNINFNVHSVNGAKIYYNTGLKILELCNTNRCLSNVFNVQIEDGVLAGIKQNSKGVGNIYNKDTIPEESEIDSSYIGVTTAEMKDPAVLRDKSFACYGVKV